MEISTYSYTCKNGREINEDSFSFFWAEGNGAWVVADGLGGHACGEIASLLAVDSIINGAKTDGFFAEDFLTDKGILSLIREANKAIVKEQENNPSQKGMRTTVVAALYSGGLLKYTNVGDSRFYYFRNNLCHIQSKDHTVSQMSVSLGEITSDQIRFDEDRNKLLKVLGGGEDLGLEPIGNIKPVSGDAFLLCTDGFWELVYEREMEIDLLKSNSPQKWLESMLSRLLPRIPLNSDNFTAICCYVL